MNYILKCVLYFYSFSSELNRSFISTNEPTKKLTPVNLNEDFVFQRKYPGEMTKYGMNVTVPERCASPN